MNILQFPPTAGQTTPPTTGDGADQLRDVVRELLDRFYGTRCIARGMTAGSINDRRRVVERFLTESGVPPWQITPYHYDVWISRLVRAGRILVTTQRAYQSAIATCFEYWQSDTAVQNHLQRTYGATIRCPVTEENRILHKDPNQRIRRKIVPTREHISQLMQAIEQLRDAYWSDPRTLRRGWCTERNRIAFALQYYCALRISEIVSLDTHSFHEASWTARELGRYGLVSVMGKGSAGQGPKQRDVMVTDVNVRVLMEWYMQHVRPHFESTDTEPALFLTRRGTRLRRSYYVHVFKKYVRLAGLMSMGYTTHALRRAGLTHDAERIGIEFARQKAGHIFLATTQDYVAVSDEDIRTQHRDAIASTLARVEKRLEVKSSINIFEV